MDYFFDIEFKKGIITVLGADKNSEFVSALEEYLKKSGTVSLSDDKSASLSTDYLIIAPDKVADKKFIVHTTDDVCMFKAKGSVIGVVSVEALLKNIEDSVIGSEDFCAITNMAKEDLVYPLALAKVIENREKYDLFYIDDITNPDRRFTAREISRRIKYGAGVRIVNRDSNYVEQLQAHGWEVL